MKGRILAAALAFVLAAAVLAGINIPVARTEQPVEMVVRTSLGDPAAARGLTVDYRVSVDNCLRWYTQYRPAEGANDTAFYLTYRKENINGYFRYITRDTQPWNLMGDIGSSEVQRDPIARQLLTKVRNGEGEPERGGRSIRERVYPFDYYDYYPLRLSSDSKQEGIGGYLGQEVYLPFDKLRIPTTPADSIELGYYFEMVNGEVKDAYQTLSGDMYVVNQFTPYSVRNEDSVVVTVGFDAGVTPEADWAPEGFGLWYMPIRKYDAPSTRTRSYTRQTSETVRDNFPVPEECRLVYPLDIEQQRVMLLRQSNDGAYLLLVTVEHDRYVLRVLDSADYHLVKEIDLTAAEVWEGSRLRYLTDEEFAAFRKIEDAAYQVRPAAETQSGENELYLEERGYPAVTMRQGENFVAIMMGECLAVLAPSAEGYDLRFVCDTVTYGSQMRQQTPDGDWELVTPYHWFTDEEEPSHDKTPRSFDSIYDTVAEEYTMAYDGTRLAAATYMGTDLLLSIYGPDGLEYAEISGSSVLSQEGLGSSSTQTVAQDVIEDVEEIWFSKPGLTWQ